MPWRRGDAPGAGIVAGSVAWYDGGRGVLSLARDAMSDDRLLECVKAMRTRGAWANDIQVEGLADPAERWPCCSRGKSAFPSCARALA